MTSLVELDRYLRRLGWRFRWFVGARGLAISCTLILLFTLGLVVVANRYEFAGSVVTPLRLLLYLFAGAALVLLLLIPLGRQRVTREVERLVPAFQQRLLTVREQRTKHQGWAEMLAEETLQLARTQQPEKHRPSRVLVAFSLAAMVACGILLWLITAAPGYWGYGAGLLWTGVADGSKKPIYSIEVQPGNKTIRRRSNQTVTARLQGFSAERVLLHARYGQASRWDTVPMEGATDSGLYRFVFTAVSEPIEYWVEASHSQTRHFAVNVRDLPGVRRIRVRLHYPAELNLQDVAFEGSGDIRAVAGTDATVEIETDRPMPRGILVLPGGKKVVLTPTDDRARRNLYTAQLEVRNDGAYHVEAIDEGEEIRISDDYFIEARKDEPPLVKIARPGQDPHVSPIEELPITINASDDFGLNGLELHYAVNGGQERTVPLLKTAGLKDAEGHTTVAFEDLNAQPGDMVSMYAVARDAHSTARSEIVFAQADPFDYKFSQAQQAGNMSGGQGEEPADISQKQKQLIAATFNQLKSDHRGAAQADDAKFLASEQEKLSQQATTLAQRMASRELSASGSEFEQFAKLLTEASASMLEAADQLKPARWKDALSPEQKALTSLLRAESLFRNIQVSMARQGGGQGGNNAGRDLARMQDLELDTTKNQYETASSPSADGNRQKELDAARQRLEALARRQQELAAQNTNKNTFEQRWEQEQLRREAEELRRELQQLAQSQSAQSQATQNQQGQNQQGQNQPGQNQQSSAQGQPGQRQSGGQRQQQAQNQSGGGGQLASGDQQANGQGKEDPRSAANRQALREQQQAADQASRALARAEEEMRQAASNHDSAAAARAGQRLRDAQRQMAEALGRQAGGSVSELASRAEQIAREQRELADHMKQMYGAGDRRSEGERQMSSADRLRAYAAGGDGRTGDNVGSLPEMNDPTMRYGYRRRFYMGGNPAAPARPATEGERQVADGKERLAAQVEALERQIQQQAQAISGSKPGASAKLFRALSDIEGQELALRLGKNAEWMRLGYGDRNLNMEDGVTAGLQQLGRALRDVELQLKAPDSKENGNGKGDVPNGTRTAAREQAPDGYRDAVADYFKKLSSGR